MTQPNRPRIEVPPPARRRMRGGLLDAANFHPNVDRLGVAGVQYLSDACTLATCSWPPTCFYPDAPTPPPKSTTDCCPDWITGDPFTVYAVACSDRGTVEGDDQYLRDRAVSNLENGRWRCIESQLASHMAASAVDVSQPPGSGPLGVAGAIAALEQALSFNYDGEGVIHGPAYASAFMAKEHQLCSCERSDGQRETQFGNRVSLGPGYPANSPTGEASTACTFWLYATGQVDVWAGPVSVKSANDLAQNKTSVIAEQVFAITTDCAGVYAARVDLPECCLCGNDLPERPPTITSFVC